MSIPVLADAGYTSDCPLLHLLFTGILGSHDMMPSQSMGQRYSFLYFLPQSVSGLSFHLNFPGVATPREEGSIRSQNTGFLPLLSSSSVASTQTQQLQRADNTCGPAIQMQVHWHLGSGFLTRLVKERAEASVIWGLCGRGPASVLTHTAADSFTSSLAVNPRHRFLVTWACPQGSSQASPWLPWADDGAGEKAGPKWKPQSLCNLISEGTSHRFCHILSIRSVSLGPDHIQGKGITQEGTKRWGHWGLPSRLPTTLWWDFPPSHHYHVCIFTQMKTRRKFTKPPGILIDNILHRGYIL